MSASDEENSTSDDERDYNSDNGDEDVDTGSILMENILDDSPIGKDYDLSLDESIVAESDDATSDIELEINVEKKIGMTKVKPIEEKDDIIIACRKLETVDEIRKNMRDIFSQYIPSTNNVKAIEISLYNKCIKNTNNNFAVMYKTMGYEIFGKLSTTHTLKTVRTEILEDTSLWDSDVFNNYKNKLALQHEILENPDDMNIEEGAFECRKCGNKKIKSYVAQLRSGDEGMTGKFTCIKCGFRWST